jgi:hypothetical protein
LVMRLISYPAIARHAAFALESLSENELSLFADDVLAMITIAAKRFDNQ